MASACPTQEAILDELDRRCPGVPLLALGQTVFWDEPVKAGVALALAQRGQPRAFYAGVHDTDYFAKVPGATPGKGYRLLPHNDTTTRGLWSAAGEISALFGSETVIDRERLHAASVGVDRLERARPGLMDELTEAYGWRGVASLAPKPPVVAETPLGPLLPSLIEAVEWATQVSLDSLASDTRRRAEPVAQRLRQLLCDHADLPGAPGAATLSDYFQALLKDAYSLTAGEPVPVEVTATSRLLRFNSHTATLPRFDLPRLFVDPATREAAVAAYNESVRGTEMYTLDRFGSWALPFDVVVPGHGRGTLRLAPRAIIVMTPDPVFVSLKRPAASLQEVADALTRKFGERCVLVGKAVTLIGMLAREFVFVFHHGASSYVGRSRDLHRRLAEAGHSHPVHPILRVRYSAWDHLEQCTSWFHLPPVLQGAFGAEDLCAPSFARRWSHVADEQRQILQRLGELRRPLDLIQFLADRAPAAWATWLEEYRALHHQMEGLHRDLSAIKAEKARAKDAWRAAKQARAEAEHAKGRHWRAAIFDRHPTEADWAERERLSDAVESAAQTVRRAQNRWHELELRQEHRVTDPAIQQAHQRRRNLEMEAELARARLVRQAVTASEGLTHAAQRPTGWWFPLVCPDGTWFRRTVAAAEYRLEDLDP